MNEKAESPILDLPWIAVPLAMVGAFLLWDGLSKSVSFMVLHGTIILCVAIAVWFQQPWARFSGALYFSLVAAGKLYQQFVTDFTTSQMLAVGGCASLAWALWHWRETPAAASKRPLVSIVLLLRQGRFLNNKSLARAAASAWGGQFSPGSASDSGNVVAGESPLFMIRDGKTSYLVHNQNQAYFDPAKDDLSKIKETSVRDAVAEHRGWIAVDLLEAGRDARNRAEAYPKIGSLLAELAGPDCVAVVCPELAFISVYDDTVEDKLRSPDPLKALRASGQGASPEPDTKPPAS